MSLKEGLIIYSIHCVTDADSMVRQSGTVCSFGLIQIMATAAALAQPGLGGLGLCMLLARKEGGV